jgi:hypothetical protein
MGHEVQHMSAVHLETISDERLKVFTNHVHGWLFPPAKPLAQDDKDSEGE